MCLIPSSFWFFFLENIIEVSEVFVQWQNYITTVTLRYRQLWAESNLNERNSKSLSSFLLSPYLNFSMLIESTAEMVAITNLAMHAAWTSFFPDCQAFLNVFPAAKTLDVLTDLSPWSAGQWLLCNWQGYFADTMAAGNLISQNWECHSI